MEESEFSMGPTLRLEITNLKKWERSELKGGDLAPPTRVEIRPFWPLELPAGLINFEEFYVFFITIHSKWPGPAGLPARLYPFDGFFPHNQVSNQRCFSTTHWFPRAGRDPRGASTHCYFNTHFIYFEKL